MVGHWLYDPHLILLLQFFRRILANLARHAAVAEKAALFHPGLQPVLYFPWEHLAAVYVPRHFLACVEVYVAAPTVCPHRFFVFLMLCSL